MSAKTSIEWTDRTWNPVTGCSKVSPGCAHCYAESIANRLWPTTYRPVLADGSGKTLDTISTSHHEDYLANGLARPRRFEDVWTHPDRLLEPLAWRKPARVFVNSMSDLFHEGVPDEFICRVFTVMRKAERHTFQVLTKRADRMRSFMSRFAWRTPTTEEDRAGVRGMVGYVLSEPLPKWHIQQPVRPLPNVWLGVSVENQRYADERIPLLLATQAAVRFISAEPLLGPVNLTEIAVPDQYSGKYAGHGHTFNALQREDDLTLFNAPAHLDLVIVGGESGPEARPFDVAWARSIVAQCRAAGVAAFVKQLGATPFVVCSSCNGKGSSDVRSDNYCGRCIGLHRETFFGVRDRKGGDMSEWPADLQVRQLPEQRERVIG